MQLRLLHLDDALLRQEAFIGACNALDARHIDVRAAGADIRLWGRFAEMERISVALEDDDERDGDGPTLTWLGSGDFHHVTALLVELAARRRAAPITVVHFDNHPDWVRHRRTLHCGSWVSHVLRRGTATRVLSLGVTSDDLSFPELKGADLQLVAAGDLVVFPLRWKPTAVVGRYPNGPAHSYRRHRIHWQQFSRQPEAETAERVLGSILTDAVYVTIDKDVLDRSEAHTNWDQGRLSMADLVAWLSVIARNREIVGADIVGDFSVPHYSGPVLDVCLKRGETLIDQGIQRARDHSARVNEAGNLTLLSTMAGLLC